MKSSIVLVAAAAILCLVAFPTTAVGSNPRLFWPKPIQRWPNPLEASKFVESFMSTSHRFNYGDSKVWKCTYSNGSAPAISISPSIPFTPSPSTPSPKTSPPPPTPSPPPPKPSPPPPAPKTSPPPPTPSPPPPAPKKSPSPPPPAPKKSPSPPPPSEPSNPPPEHHHGHQNRWEHIESCMSNMGAAGVCRGQMEFSYFTRMFQVSDYCCNLIVNMKNECDDVIWGFFTDPFFVPLVRCTCHVTY